MFGNDRNAVGSVELRRGIEIVDFQRYLASNVYSRQPAVRLSINVGSMSGRVSDLASPARASIMELITDGDADAPLADLLANAILAADLDLSRSMNFYIASPPTFLVRSLSRDTLVLVWESDDAQMSYAAASAVVEAFAAALRGEPAAENYAGKRQSNIERAERRRLSNSTAVLVAAAKRSQISFTFVARNHLVLGLGKHQKQLFSTITGSTSFAAAKMALDKRRGNRLMAHAGLPVPRQMVVRTRSEAVDAAEHMGTMVVVKPAQGNQSRGVSVKLRGRQAVEAAFDLADAEGAGGVLIEEYASGRDYRVTVVGRGVVAAVECLPPHVSGDGERPIRELIEELNRDPDRDDFRLSRIEVDEELLGHLASRRLTLDSVPKAGQSVTLRPTGHLARGGVPIDVTDTVHPKNIELCQRVVDVVGLDVAGIDLIMPDITRDYNEVGCTVIEVNARPGIEFHLWARGGKPRDVSDFILKNLYADPRSSDVPAVVVVGERHTGMVAKAVDQRFRSDGRRVALLAKTGAFVNGEPQEFSRRMDPQLLARDPFLDAFVYAVSPDRLLSHGLGLNACHAVSVTPNDAASADMLGQVVDGILQKTNRGYFLVDEDDANARASLAAVPYARIVLVSMRAKVTADMERHLRQGGLILFMRWSADATGAHMVLASGLGDLAVEPSPMPSGSRLPKIRAAMHAMAIAHFASKSRWFE